MLALRKMALISSKWWSKWPTTKCYNSFSKSNKLRKETIMNWSIIVFYKILGVLSLTKYADVKRNGGKYVRMADS